MIFGPVRDGSSAETRTDELTSFPARAGARGLHENRADDGGDQGGIQDTEENV